MTAVVRKIIIALCLQLIIVDRTGAQYGCAQSDLVFVIGSPYTDSDAYLVQEFTRQLTTRLKSNAASNSGSVALVTFAETARVEFLLNRYHRLNDVNLALSNIRPSKKNFNSNYAIRDALRCVKDRVFVERNGDRPDAFNWVVLVSDGNYTDIAGIIKAASELTKADGSIAGVPVTTDKTVVRQYYDITEGVDYVFDVSSYQNILDLLPGLYNRLCHMDEVCYEATDLVIILDESSSIAVETYDNWYKHMLGFAKNAVDKFKIAEFYTRVAVVTFASHAYVPIHLNSFCDVRDLKKAIGKLPYRGGNTNIAEALRKTRTEVYQASHGYRPDAAHIIVLITDGMDQEGTDIIENEIHLLKQATQAHIFVVGITNEVDDEQLRQIASYPDSNHVFRIHEFYKLNDVVHEIFPSCPRI